MAIIFANGETVKVPNGIYCYGCNYSQCNIETGKVFGKDVTIDEYTYCTLFNRRTPKDIKLAQCIWSEIK